ncbi:MAG: nuclear transport factor 2 family protein [Pseudomonadota bacterium]
MGFTPGQQNRNGFNKPLQTIFQDFMADCVFSDDHTAQQIMEIYFTPDFSEEIDGRHLSHDIFQRRIGRMRQDTEVEEQDFVEMTEDGDRIFTMHYTRGKSLVSGQHFEIRAIAFFRFDGKRIKKGYLNSVTLGDPSDADFASHS